MTENSDLNITYRTADPLSDYEFARAVHHAGYKDVVTQQFGSWDEKLQDQFFDEGWKRTPNRIILLNDNPIGIVAHVVEKDHIFLSEIQLLPEYQGRGIGTAILKEYIELSKMMKLPLKLQVLRLNKAQNLYRKLGFQVTETNEIHVKMIWQGYL